MIFHDVSYCLMMFHGISCVIISEDAHSKSSVTKGCPLTSTVFALYTNDLMSELSGFGVKLVNHNVKGLMYADDVALVAESGADLQAMLDSLSCYCDKWNLSVNTRKSKVVVLGGGRFDSGCSAVYVQRFKIGACG